MSCVKILIVVIKDAYNLWWRHCRDCQSLTKWYQERIV